MSTPDFGALIITCWFDPCCVAPCSYAASKFSRPCKKGSRTPEAATCHPVAFAELYGHTVAFLASDTVSLNPAADTTYMLFFRPGLQEFLHALDTDW